MTSTATSTSTTTKHSPATAPVNSIPPINTLLRNHRNAQNALDFVQKLFVIGCGKSGTTWLRNILHGHPEIAIFGEGSFAWRLIPLFTQAANLFNQHQSKGQPPFTQLDEPDLRLIARLIIDNAFWKYLQHSEKPVEQIKIVGDKTPQHTIAIPLLNTLYPESKFIHIYRDPRDVATSAWFHDGVNDPHRNFEQFIKHFMNEVWPLQVGTARSVGPLLGPERFLELRYEDLLDNERDEIKRLLTFLNVKSSDDSITRCSDAGSFKKMTGGRERGDEDNSKFYRKGVAGDWRNHLPEDLVRTLCKPIAELMTACGYQPTT